VLSIAVGTSLLVFFFLTNYEGRSAAITSITASETISPYFPVGQKLPLKPAITGLPSFGLVCALFLNWLVMLHLVFYEVGRFHSKGIRVSVMQHVPSAEVAIAGLSRWCSEYKVPAQAWPQSYI
jgi:hypothetical protein